MSDHERIVRDPRVVGGEPVFRGTGVPLRTVLASLAEGTSTEQILADFPGLSGGCAGSDRGHGRGGSRNQGARSARWDLDRLAAHAGEDAVVEGLRLAS